MNLLVRLVTSRLVRMLAGYFAASLVAALLMIPTIYFLTVFWDSTETRPLIRSSPIDWWSEIRATAFAMLLYTSVAGVLAAPVALPAILFAEYRSIQSPVYYGSIGLIAATIATGGFILVLGPLGVLPGLSYWLIAGRTAGE